MSISRSPSPDYDTWTNEQCDQLKLHLQNKLAMAKQIVEDAKKVYSESEMYKDRAAYSLRHARHIYNEVCKECDLKILALTESRKKPARLTRSASEGMD